MQFSLTVGGVVIFAMMARDTDARSLFAATRSFTPTSMSHIVSSRNVPTTLSTLRGGDTTQKVAALDLRSQLSEIYGVEENNGAITSSNDTCTAITTIIYGGSFKDALLSAKQQGRLLMIFIPQKPPPSGKNKVNDSDAIDTAVMKAFLSHPVAEIAERAPPKKKSSKAESTSQKNGSFVLWTSTSGIGSKESSLILKRIQGGKVQRTNAAGQKRPLLLVVYPHSDARSGGDVVPILLAQHHCTPPPDGAKLATWLQTLRQRSGKYYATLWKQQQELLWQKERVEGYQQSIQSDVKLKERRIQEALEQQRLKEEEKRRAQEVEERRTQFLELLNKVTVSDGDSNEKGESGPITTVALRFGDGRTGTRRFTSSATIQNIFHWVDAEFAMECELVLLQTMNGQRSFEWRTDDDDDSSLQVKLSDAGLGKMFGLRVTTKASPTVQPKERPDPSKS